LSTKSELTVETVDYWNLL